MWSGSRAWATYGSTLVALSLVLGASSTTLRIVPVAALECVAVSATLQLLYSRLGRRERWRVPYSAIITGLIIGCVVPQWTPLPVIAGAATAAFLSKILFRWVGGPIFNPAAVGLLLPIGLFGLSADSWARSISAFPWTLVALPPLALAVYSSRRLPVAATFAASFLILSFVLSGYVHDFSMSWSASLLLSGYYVIAFVMVTDPRTSPRDGPAQSVLGALLALATFGLSAAGVPSPFLYALLLANLGTAYVLGRRPVLPRLFRSRLPSAASTSRPDWIDAVGPNEAAICSSR